MCFDSIPIGRVMLLRWSHPLRLRPAVCCSLCPLHSLQCWHILILVTPEVIGSHTSFCHCISTVYKKIKNKHCTERAGERGMEREREVERERITNELGRQKFEEKILAVGTAHEAMFWPTPGLTDRTLSIAVDWHQSGPSNGSSKRGIIFTNLFQRLMNCDRNRRALSFDSLFTGCLIIFFFTPCHRARGLFYIGTDNAAGPPVG